MAVYASEKAVYLNKAFESIWVNQILKPTQVIVIEDGKLPKELSEVIKKWENLIGRAYYRVVNEENIGLTKSLNKGLRIVTGDYIARMDSDDISMPDRLKHQKEFLDNHPEVAIVGGSLQEFDEENDCLGVRKYPKTNDDVLKYIHRASPLAHPTVMMRREIFDNGLRYDECYRTSQDIALWFDALAAGYKIGNLSEVTLKFRRNGDVYKRRSRKKAVNEFKIYMRGIYRLNGIFTYKYIYPLARFVFRMMPVGVVRWIYGSSIRTAFLQK